MIFMVFCFFIIALCFVPSRAPSFVKLSSILGFFMGLPLCLLPVHASAEWTPLIKATDFDGIKSDMLLTASGVVTILLIIIGLGLLIRALNR